jgi:S-adenosylmethionine/arginine decarboxylase-like enzyme
MEFTMQSHHFIGVGMLSQRLKRDAAHPDRVIHDIALLIEESGLKVISQEAVRFENGGATLVWILAESHLVIHLWTEEGFATIDLHVCDYQTSNMERAEHLKILLSEFCFDKGEATWHKFKLDQPVTAAR